MQLFFIQKTRRLGRDIIFFAQTALLKWLILFYVKDRLTMATNVVIFIQDDMVGFTKSHGNFISERRGCKFLLKK